MAKEEGRFRELRRPVGVTGGSESFWPTFRLDRLPFKPTSPETSSRLELLPAWPFTQPTRT